MFDRSKNLAIASAILLATGPAFAGQGQPVVVYGEQPANVRTERVSYTDLNLATDDHQKILNSRVSGAVKRVCLYRESIGRMFESSYDSCADGAWDVANPQIGQAIARAHEIALNGKSSIAAAAITIRVR
jgi:UrcA family protein